MALAAVAARPWAFVAAVAAPYLGEHPKIAVTTVAVERALLALEESAPVMVAVMIPWFAVVAAAAAAAVAADTGDDPFPRRADQGPTPT